MIPKVAKRHKILLGGYINVNVIDGSAFFLSGFAGMCARHPYVHVDLVTANPVKSWEVLDELAEYNNVDIIDPFSIRTGHPKLLGRTNITRAEYARVLSEVFEKGRHDTILIRDNSVALEFLKQTPKSRGRTYVYVTGLTFLDAPQDPREIKRLQEILELHGKLVCQTEEIKALVRSHLEVADEGIIILPPHVPDPEENAYSSLENVDEPSRLVYTGKFFKDWKIDSILAAVKSANLDGAELSLDVAGDQFRHTEEDPYFVENVSYLLKNSDYVSWHGRVPRNISRQLISNSHVGIGWRSEKLNTSSELSTKILEYGALGRPSIINRTPMHERLLGKDYPLFVDRNADFRLLLQRLRESSSEVLIAARKCYELATRHSYTAVSRDILPLLGNMPSAHASLAYVNQGDLHGLISDEVRGRKATMQFNGIWVEFIYDERASETVGELATRAERDFQAWQHARTVTRTRIEAFAKSDSLGDLGQNNQSVRFESQDFESVNLLRESLEETKQELESLKSMISQYERDLEKALERELYWREYAATQTQRLNAFRDSRLGSLQRRIWKFRRE